MPKKAFFSIAQQKQDRILNCALDEFSGSDFHSASINRIVQSAGIPRGSFYQYFEDKEDLYFYLLETILEKEHTSFFAKNHTESTSPNLLLYHQIMFSFNLSMLNNPRYQAFFRNLFISMDYSLGARYGEVIERKRISAIKQMGIEDKAVAEKVNELLGVLGLVTIDLLARKATRGLTDKETWDMYYKTLDILGLEHPPRAGADNPE